jgi:deoxyadenosine/deoxycytidine kinase
MSHCIVSIEGNIGSGKTTLLNQLKLQFANNPTVIFLKEPLDEWQSIQDSNGNNMLQKFYEDQNKYGFAFQMMAFLSRFKLLKNTIQSLDPTQHYIIITERSINADSIFANMLFYQNKMEDVCYQIYTNWVTEFSAMFQVNLTVYINTNALTCYERIQTRHRGGEELISMSYLQDCHNFHQAFISNLNHRILVIHGDDNIYEHPEILEQWIHTIKHNIRTIALPDANL